MDEKPLETESFPDAGSRLDALGDHAAMRLMARDQAKAAKAVTAALGDITGAARAAHAKLAVNDTARLIYCGAGTSARIGMQDGAELAPTFGWPHERLGFLIAGGEAALLRASEGAEDDRDAARRAVAAANIDDDDVVIALSASGATPYPCAALEAAQERGACTIGIANNPGAPLAEIADYGIILATGGEMVAGSTRLKAATAQKICLNMITTFIMMRLGKVRDGLMVAMQAGNEKLRARQKRIDAALGKSGGAAQ